MGEVKFLLTILLLVTIDIAVAQNADPIITKEENSLWLQELEDGELEEKLKMIRDRWVADSAVEYYVSANPHTKPSDYKRKTRIRPLYLFAGGKENLIFPPNPSSEKIAEVSKMLIPENVSEVQLIKGIKAQALYGQRGSSGVIFIRVTENGTFEKLASELHQKEQ